MCPDQDRLSTNGHKCSYLSAGPHDSALLDSLPGNCVNDSGMTVLGRTFFGDGHDVDEEDLQRKKQKMWGRIPADTSPTNQCCVIKRLIRASS